MGEIRELETPHERRVTWSLIALVLVFVLLMTCIILWITTSLIRERRGSASPTSLPASTSPIAATSTPTEPSIKRTESPTGPILVDATWTPFPGGRRDVQFVYWFVKPNRIRVGECLQLTWETKYAASLKLYRNNELILDSAPPARTLQDCPTQPGYAVYRLVAKNNIGQSNWIQLQVKVLEAP